MERGVGRHALAPRAAEHGDDRAALEMAVEIPERDVDRAEQSAADAGRAQPRVQRIDPARVLPEQQRRDRPPHLERAGDGRPALAPADGALAAGDAHEQAVDARLQALAVADRAGQEAADREGFDALDAHDDSHSSCVSVAERMGAS